MSGEHSSSSDDDYDPAEVTVHAVATASAATTTAGRPPASTAASADVAPTTSPPTSSSAFPFVRTAPRLVPGSEVLAASASSSPQNVSASPPPQHHGGPLHNSPDAGYRLHSDIKGRVRCLALNPAGTTLCAGSEDGQLCMWDFAAAMKSHRVQPTRVLTPFVNRISGLQPIIALAWARDGGYLVACQDGDFPALVRATGEQLGYCAMGERGLMDVLQCKGHRAPVTCVAPHAHDAAAFYTGSQDGTVRLWSSATFKQHSVYAVKHGSGQVTDTHVVESVASLDGVSGGLGRVFASGGEDGRVQIWDSRVKYRPGGAVATLDLYARAASGKPGRAAAEEDPFMEKHVGGMLEVRRPSEEVVASASAEAAGGEYALAVRLGSTVKLIDLRRLTTSAAATATGVVEEVATGLSHVLDTTALTVGVPPMALLTCTSRAGYRGALGGHVVQFSSGPSGRLDPTWAWRAGRQDEDVLCACADASREDGCVYAGLSSGEVVVHGAFSGRGLPQPVESWLQTRPEREGYTRVVGQKAPRPGPGHGARDRDDDDALMRDLF